MIDASPVAAAAFAPLGLFEHRTGRAVVGRPAELAAIEDAIGVAEGGRLSALTVEGEPGSGRHGSSWRRGRAPRPAGSSRSRWERTRSSAARSSWRGRSSARRR